MGGPWDKFEFSHGFHTTTANIILPSGIYNYRDGAWHWTRNREMAGDAR